MVKSKNEMSEMMMGVPAKFCPSPPKPKLRNEKREAIDDRAELAPKDRTPSTSLWKWRALKQKFHDDDDDGGSAAPTPNQQLLTIIYTTLRLHRRSIIILGLGGASEVK
jgi:hypothetical protein